MKNPYRLIPAHVILFSLLLVSYSVMAQSDGNGTTKTTPPTPPMAEKKPKTTTIHGDTLIDNYFWLREKTNPQVMEYLHNEDAYAEAAMKPTVALQAQLYKEMLSHIKQTDVNVPYRWGNYFYYTRTEEGKQYPIYCRTKGSVEAKEEIILDQNELAKGQKFMVLAHSIPATMEHFWLIPLTTPATANTPFRSRIS